MKNVYLLALGAFLVGTAELIVSGILNELAASLGVAEAQAGQLVTAYSLGFAVGTPVLAALTSRFDRKPLSLASLLAFALISLVTALIGDYVFLLAARVVMGAGAGLFCVIALGSVSKLVGANKLGLAMGSIALAFSLSMVAGVPLGVAMAKAWSWPSIFFALAIGSVLVVTLLRRSLPQIAPEAPEPFFRQFAVLGQGAVIGPLLLSLLLAAGNSVMLTYMQPIVERALDLSPDALSVVLLSLGVIGIAGSQLGGLAVDRFGSERVVLLSLAASAAALAVLPLIADASAAAGLTLIGVWGFSMFCAAPAINAYIAQSSPRTAHVVLGLNISFTHLGLALGAAAGGWLIKADDSGLYHPWLAAAFLFSALAVGALSIRRQPNGATKKGPLPRTL